MLKEITKGTKSNSLSLDHRPFYRIIAFGVIAAGFFFHLWFSTTFWLVPDEAYYWLWSKHPSLSYATKGPVVAWCIAISSLFFGDSILAIRFMALLFSIGSGVLIYFLAEKLFDSRTALLSVLFAASCPIFSIGSVLMTIDSPSLFFWLLSAFLFLQALVQDKRKYWIFTGMSLGIGFLAKYVNAFELLCFSLYLLFYPDKRKLLLSQNYAYFLLFSFLFSLPVWLWNATHGWVTVHHLLHRGGLTSSFVIEPTELIKFLQEQLLSYSPFLFIGIISSVILVLWSPSFRSSQTLFLLTLFLPVFLFYTFLSLHQAAKGNWTVTAVSGGMILLAYIMVRLFHLPHIKVLLLSGLAISFLQTALLHREDLSFVGIKPEKDPLLRPRGWQSVAVKLNEIQKKFHPEYFIANDYALASELQFLIQSSKVFIPTCLQAQTQFAFWESYPIQHNAKAIYISNDQNGLLPECLKKEFSKIEHSGGFWREYKGKKIEYYTIWLLSSLPSASRSEN
ncbi:ArnT family glycosyltransferase [Methylacidiphilum kamchatkense]|uniref:Dolichyl-phosphate-mannose-protein mannosyltransferase n=1 Tax=Methylacidiphilum kamchatkense Kam1 TaxID=1202785 RepID=A0A516TJG5_9BACT|nr:glycosyltransferase family 39 protein [Methylacidiphilum kamchatkense]QDQ41366.1 dolichyl-phosphate-mannose-protein mannosyltransferase [Methylacidiphilum kamchatkense Kam1]